MTAVNSGQNEFTFRPNPEIENDPELIAARALVSLGEIAGHDYVNLYHKVGERNAAKRK